MVYPWGKTIRDLVVKDIWTEYQRSARSWADMPGAWNSKPGVNYRLGVVWGNRMQISWEREVYKTHVQLRVVFNGWGTKTSPRYRSSLRFYTDSSYSRVCRPAYRTGRQYSNDWKYRPNNADRQEYFYYRVTRETDRAWRMWFGTGMYAALQNNVGAWKTVKGR